MTEEVERAKEMLQKPLYRFLRDAFIHWPAESTASLGPLMNLWVTYLTPWTLSFPVPLTSTRSTSGASSPLSRGIEAVTAVATDRKSSPKFAGDTSHLSVSTASGSGRKGQQPQSDQMHVLHNVPFYSELMKHFLELCCNRVPVDAEGTATALLSVLRALATCPDVLKTLEDVETTYNKFVVVNPYATGATASDPPPVTRYDAFLPFIQSQLLDWDPLPPPEQGSGVALMSATPMGPQAGMYSMSGRTGHDPMYAAATGAGPVPPPIQKLSMYSVDQDGLPQVALALLHRLDRDAAMVGPSHPLRTRVPKLRKAAFTVFHLDRLGESIMRAPSIGKIDFKTESGTTISRRGIGWASFEQPKTSEEMYMGDWHSRPLTDMEFGPLARVLIAVSNYINSTLGLTGASRVRLRPAAEYGNMLSAAGLCFFVWFLFLPL